MKYLSTIGMLLLVGGVAADVTAQCSPPGQYKSLVNGGLDNMRVAATAPSGEQWNEDHCGSGNSGNLYKYGGDPAIDPYALRGTWSLDPNTSEVTYDYGPGQVYTWRVQEHKNNGNLCWDEGPGGTSNTIAISSSTAGATPCSAP